MQTFDDRCVGSAVTLHLAFWRVATTGDFDLGYAIAEIDHQVCIEVDDVTHADSERTLTRCGPAVPDILVHHSESIATGAATVEIDTVAG